MAGENNPPHQGVHTVTEELGTVAPAGTTRKASAEDPADISYSLDDSSSSTPGGQTPNSENVNETKGAESEEPSQNEKLPVQNDASPTNLPLEYIDNAPASLSGSVVVDQTECLESDELNYGKKPPARDDDLPVIPPPESIEISRDGRSPRQQNGSRQRSPGISGPNEEASSRRSSNSRHPHRRRSAIYSYPGSWLPPEGSDVSSSSDNEFTFPSIEAAAKASESAREWLPLRNEPGLENMKATLDNIMMVYGHEEVKSHCLSTVKLSNTKADETSTTPRLELTVSAVFGGNEGLGLGRLAELYAHLLEELGFGELLMEELDSKADVERILKPIRNQAVPCIQTLQTIIQIGKINLSADVLAALNALLNESRKLHPKVYIIACQTWSSANEASAFTNAFPKTGQTHNVFMLQDYTQEQLQEMLVLAAQESDMEFEDGPDSVHLRTVVELISHGRGTPGFRNWTAVRDGLAAIETNERRRNPRQGGLKILTKADMLGETAAELQKRSSAWQKLDAMIGLDEVKKTIRLYFSQIKYEHYRALQGRQPRKPMLNRLFLGPPGTGKTTVARLLAEIFSELGIVSNDAVVIREPSTLIGSYVGHSEEKTRDAFEEALGGVLIIDNAHTFFSGGTHMTRESPDEFRSGIIDTLVGQYHRHEENAAHERVTVFFVGQKDSVVELLETGNPGLGRMLPLNEAFHFPTYSENHLGEILQREIKTAGLTASPEAIATAHGLLSLAKHRPNFANATAVGSLLCTAMSRHQVRVLAMVDVRKALAEPLGPKDFDPDCDRPRLARQRFAKLFSDLQGAEYIMDQFLGYQELVVQLRGRGIDPRPYVPLSFVFKGSPGTGKTTVARKVAQVYYEMGFLSAPEMIECSVAQLVSAGNSSSRGSGVERTFERALGKVLFVDEAYLLRHIGGHGAIGDMVDCMTKERFAGKLVVVLAGYDEDMGQLLQENPGLRSRFATTVSFRRMTPTDAILLLKRLVDKVGIRITGLEPGDPLRQQAVRLLARLAATRTWANGRDVEALARMLIQDTFKASMTQQQNSTDAKAAMAESGDIEVKAMAVVLLLASHLGSAIELDEKNSTVREHEAGRDNRARVGVGRNRR